MRIFIFCSLLLQREILVGLGYVQECNCDKVTLMKEINISVCVPDVMVLYHRLSYHGAVVRVNLLVALASQ